ncbi:MAG: hypothetical protein CSA70_04795 [Rhodobacterales bacterium]|nr:MAG: hypothetical protein CSA70_04795 [Rhodobacterales bacterium]
MSEADKDKNEPETGSTDRDDAAASIATQNDTTAPIAAPDRLALIEHIYQLALEPDSFDDFMTQWEAHVTNSVNALETLRNDTPQAVMDSAGLHSHFDTAIRLLRESRPAPVREPGIAPDTGEDSQNSATLRIGKGGEILSMNPAAQTMLGKVSTVYDLPLDANGQGAFEQFLSHDAPRHPLVVRLWLPDDTAGARPGSSGSGSGVGDSGDETTTRVALFHLRPVRTAPRDGAVAELSDAMPSWPATMDDLLTTTFEFSRSENDISRALFQGLDIADIAQARGSTVSTVRTQVKRILGKTGARSQVELTRVLMTLARVAMRNDNAPAPEDGPMRLTISGREIPLVVHGAPHGRPVFFFHGMLDGVEISDRLQNALDTANLRLIMPTRPGFGNAAFDAGPPQQAPERFALDCMGIMDQLRIERTALLGHMGGSVFADTAAHLLGQRVVGLLHVAGGVPLWSDAQIKAMSHRQRVVALTARYLPAMLPLVLRAGIRQINTGGIEKFVHALFAESPPDLKALKDPELHDLIMDRYRFSIAQGHKAFEADSLNVLSDWSDKLERRRFPMILLHGTQDPVVAIRTVRDYHKVLGEGCELRELPDGGQQILLTHPDHVVKALCDLFDRDSGQAG